MTWKQEGKEVLQSMYGGYCNMCRVLEEEPISYSLFTVEVYNKIKEKYDKRRNIGRE